MTGGSSQTGVLNQELAAVADEAGIAFAVGSQRVMLEHREMTSDFAVRSHIPRGVLLGNIGAVQLPAYSLDDIAELVKRIDADGVCVHLNPAQELCQPEGDRAFCGLLEQIARLVDKLEGRVLIKETGAGMSPRLLKSLSEAGVRYIDVAGCGGTSWTKVEMYRHQNENDRAFAETFADWGIPTAVSIIAARKVCAPSTCVMGSGGLFTGLDCAKAIAAGADMAGFARAVLLAWHRAGREGAATYIARVKRELKTAMLLTGSTNLAALQKAPRVITGELSQWLASLDQIK